MPSTRRSTRLASSQTSSSPAKEDSPRAAVGSKRKSETGSSPAPKRGKQEVSKKQKTIEDTMDVDQSDKRDETTTAAGSSSKDVNGNVETHKHASSAGKDASKGPGETASNIDATTKTDKTTTSSQDESKEVPKGTDDLKQSAEEHQKQSEDETKTTEIQPVQNNDTSNTEQSASRPQRQDETDKQDSAKQNQDGHASADEPSTNGNAIQAHARDEETPSSIIEKGIIYFFFRGRVGIDNPSEVPDIARSYMVLRPLPHGAKLGDGPIGASENKCRLLALPKKVLPTSGQDRFMTFVEKAHTSFPELKKSFLPADDYETKTAGTRHTPPVTPIAEGVYAITTTGRDNHLAYMLTIPSSLGEVQKDMGLREQGSFIVSCKNPQFPGPSYASLPQSPDFPKEILDEFRSLRWMPLQPKHLDYENTQFLLIGESSGVEKALDVPNDKKEAKEDSPKEELERLEGEDEIRIKHLKGDDAIFADLGVNKKDYPQVPTTWND